MPAPSDIVQFLRGQLFQTPTLPRTTLVGKTVVITGANTGLGFECARQLVQLNVSNLILGCRDVTKGQTARERILADRQSETSIQVWEIDMANYESVMIFGARIAKELSRLDALIANAGLSTNEFRIAADFEETLTVNVVSTFLLSLLCLPMLTQTTIQFNAATHLTVTGSVVHCFADHKQLQLAPEGKVLQTMSQKDEADMASRYFLSKLIVLLCVQEMGKQIPKEARPSRTAVIVNCPNPGWCKTELFRQDDGGIFARNLLKLIGRSGEVGARTLTSAIVAGENTHGQYLSECQVKPASLWTRSREGVETQRQMWRELLVVLERISPGIGAGFG